MTLDIDKLLGSPGCFLLNAGPQWMRAGHETEGKKLNIFKNPERAKTVYKVYARCFNNALDLITEAELLHSNRRFARALALAIFAWEELGKSQVAADYYSGMLTDVEFKRAFKKHTFKTGYLDRVAILETSSKSAVAYHGARASRIEQIRQDALYASESNDPSTVAEEDAEKVIEHVKRHIQSILFAEQLNGRIGSAALFK